MVSKKQKKAEELRKKTQAYDLFDNPMTRAALKSMTPEQIKTYQDIGQKMYGNIDFDKSEVLSNLPPPMAEALAYVKEGIKAGLHPTDLDEDEVNLLKEVYGEEWYTKFGYTAEDLEKIVTVKKV